MFTSDIPVGRIVAQDTTDENSIRLANGTNEVLGVYEYEAQRINRTDGDVIGIVLSGIAKVVAGANVTAGKKAIADATGRAINCPQIAGSYNTIGTFLENGTVGDYVDLFIERNYVTIIEE